MKKQLDMTQAKPVSGTPNSSNGNGNGNNVNVEGLADSARSLVTDAAHTAREKLEAAREQVEDVAARAATTARDLSKQAGAGLTKVNDAVVDFVRARPYTAIGASFLAGYVIISLLRRK